MSSPLHGLRARLLARLMAKGGPRYEKLVRAWKQDLFAEARGSVVEIGAGTGPNLRYLGGAGGYVAVEPNPFMHPYLREELERRGIGGCIESRTAEAVLADLQDNSVDTVVCTLVLCSVRDPAQLLAAIRRVLNPGGKLLLLEHLGAAPGSLLCGCQHLLAPAFWLLGDGCRPTRRTGQLVRAAGFSRTHLREFHLPLGPISPHLCGWAEK